MKPIRMIPAYRYGGMTPWGGNSLRRLYGRELPDEVTGEALEVSAIPGLESRSPEGETLPELIARYGEALVGRDCPQDFPLLLKLLSAKSQLSVQVHPDDAYAALHEHKLGKTEAWVILEAEEGAHLLYGMKEGVTTQRLADCLQNGGDVEALIRKVSVKPGEVYYMPAGMVHAIGGGITLYEIQQSSDVTYRLWDYNRTDAQGNKRPLHIRQSLDVVRPELTGQTAFFPNNGENQVVELLNVPAFRLWGLSVDGELSVPADEACFGILTAIDALKLKLSGEEEEMSLAPGETLLLPASTPELQLIGQGRALLSRPGRG